MAEHSPLPWRVASYDVSKTLQYVITPAADTPGVVASVTRGKRAAADAEFIVRCVNSHDELLAALKEMVEFAHDWMPHAHEHTRVAEAVKAIAKAEGR